MNKYNRIFGNGFNIVRLCKYNYAHHFYQVEKGFITYISFHSFFFIIKFAQTMLYHFLPLASIFNLY